MVYIKKQAIAGQSLVRGMIDLLSRRQAMALPDLAGRLNVTMERLQQSVDETLQSGVVEELRPLGWQDGRVGEAGCTAPAERYLRLVRSTDEDFVSAERRWPRS